MKNILKALMLTAATLVTQFTTAQNLVPNPSFEDTVSCPNFNSQIDRALGWDSFRNTPDYFNSCNNTIVNVPDNFVGYQYAHTGVAYSGMFTYIKGATPNYREWIGCQLLQPLITGRIYNISFFANTADKLPDVGIATDKLGIRFTTVSYPQVNQIPLDCFTQLFASSIISDTMNWVQVTGSFLSDSAYQYLVIGNFCPDSLTNFLSTDSNFIYAYYYIDDISVYQSDSVTDIVKNPTSNAQIRLFPNPSTNWIKIMGDEIRAVKISDWQSRVVYSNSEFDSSNIIDISFLSKGIYLVTIETANHSQIFKKIVLQ